MFRYESIQQYHSQLLDGTTSCLTAVEHYLQLIHSQRHLNAYVNIYDEEALETARQLDEKRASGSATGRLHGVVISIKDIICYKDHPVSASSAILNNFISLYHSTAVQRLLAEEAIIIGHTNCDEFAMGSSNENSYYGPVLNALDESRVPGGSSGGSAVAVQAGLCMVSLGSDTGGSVRQPADFCGIVGFKPSYGTISRYGLIAYASSFDQIGIFARNIPDVETILRVISGPDQYDSTASPFPLKDFSFHSIPQAEKDQYASGGDNNPSRQASTPGAENASPKAEGVQPKRGNDLSETGTVSDKHPDLPVKPLRIAYFRQALESPALDPDIRNSLVHFIDQLKTQGHTVEATEFEYLDYIVPTYYILTTAEASSNLSRFDGVRYGYRDVDKNLELAEMYENTRSKGFGKEVKRRIMLGTFVLSAGYYDAYFTKAQQVRRLLVDQTNLIFSKFDIILLPTSPSTAFKIGEKMSDPISMYLADIFTVFSNLTGIPAISLPLFWHNNGMPYGVQVMSNRFYELSLLDLSNQWMHQFKAAGNEKPKPSTPEAF